MQSDQAILYSIWAADNAVYGPVELPTLISWVKDERVVAETWIYDSQNDRWRKAGNLAELQLFFRKTQRSRGGNSNRQNRHFPRHVAPRQGPG